MKPAFVFEPGRCTGCEACRLACGIENGTDGGWRTVVTFNPARHPALPTRHLTLSCNHCETAVCALGCPAGAYERDEATSAVVLHAEKCIGCRYCSWLCPYDAPKFDSAQGAMTKCTFCLPRLAVGGQPACTAACPTAALSLGPREAESREPESHGLGSFGLGPALRVMKPRCDTPPAGMEDAEGTASQPAPPRKITVRSEWTLLLFTLIMPMLVAWVGAGIVRPERKPPVALFLAFGAFALTLSTLHLGRPLQAWRAVLNVKTSWLSREVVLATLFIVLGAAGAAIPAVAAGIALTFAIDAVYRVIPRDQRQRTHSAEAVPTTALLFGIAAGIPLVTIAVALAKGVLYSLHWRRPPERSVRLLLLAIACLPGIPWPIAIAVALAGELIDRASFYESIEPTTPAGRMIIEMAQAESARARRDVAGSPDPAVGMSWSSEI